MTQESPKQILSEDFPRHQWPISGGWGYTEEDAVVIEAQNESEGIGLEYKFLEYRSYEEGIIFRPKGQQLAGFRFSRVSQSLCSGKNGRHYDKVVVKVSAYKEEDFDQLRNEWISNKGFADDEQGLLAHIEKADSLMITYEVVGWFDITSFFGKR